MTDNELYSLRKPQKLHARAFYRRRGSTSSDETIVYKPSDIITRNTAKPCLSCEEMLSDALIKESRFRARYYTKKCPMCYLLWQVLLGADDPVVEQILHYSNVGFSNVALYLPDGGTDIEELVNPHPKVKIAFSAELDGPHAHPTEQTDSLRLKFLIKYESQTKAGDRATTIVDENVQIFRVPGSAPRRSSSFKKGKHAPLERSQILPDSQLEADDRWDLCALWLKTQSPRKHWNHHLDSFWDLCTSWKHQPSRQNRALCQDVFPTRILDLSQEDKVVLRDHSGTPYVALSHRWGASQHLTTTADTFEKLKSGILLDLLPATFKDAVLATRRLGVYSLWIDALCIVQDDQVDWRNESQKMGDIYTNARFVIAAHCAADDSKGFLAHALSKHRGVRFRDPGTEEVLGIYRRSNLTADVTYSVLSKRGWVLQERLLATHTLHFTSHGVISESPGGVFSEDGQLTSDSQSPYRLFRRLLAIPVLQATSASSNACQQTRASDQREAERASLYWLDLVEQYTKCDLSREEDKLVAIAGMAKRIRSRIGAKWCAGLWSNRISEGLLWLPGVAMSSPIHPRAPSWSWAAWDGPVQYPENVKDALSGDLVTQAIFGHIRELDCFFTRTEEAWLTGPGVLRIQAHLIPLTYVKLTGDHVQMGPGPDRQGYFTNDNKDLPRLRLKQYLKVYVLHGMRNLWKHRPPPCGWIALDDCDLAPRQDLDSYEAPRILEHVWFALLGIERAKSGGLMYLGIFLARVEGHNDMPWRFQRIGCGQLSHSFVSGEEPDDRVPTKDELMQATKPGDLKLNIPHNLSLLTTVDIE